MPAGGPCWERRDATPIGGGPKTIIKSNYMHNNTQSLQNDLTVKVKCGSGYIQNDLPLSHSRDGPFRELSTCYPDINKAFTCSLEGYT